MNTKMIRLADIRIDGGTQMRESLDQGAVADLVEAICRGDDIPAIEVRFDGSEYWLVDGFHRIAAHRQAGEEQIDAVVVAGTQKEAVLAAAHANITHGVRRTNETKRRSVLAVLREAPEWSDRRIAEHVCVDHKTVATVRSNNSTGEFPSCSKRVGADGKERASQRNATDATPEPPQQEHSTDDVESRTPESEPEVDDDPPPDAAADAGSVAGGKNPTDDLGTTLSPDAEKLFARRSELRELAAELNGIKLRVLRAIREGDTLYVGIPTGSFQADCDNAKRSIEGRIPYAQCPYCDGVQVGGGCKACRGRGVMNRLDWENVPEDQR